MELQDIYTMKYLLKVVLALTSIGVIIYDYCNEFPYTKFIIAGIRRKSTKDGTVNKKWISTDKVPSSCPHFSIKNHSKSRANIRCQPRKISSQDCRDATRKYGRTPKDHKCPKKETQEITFELCEFSKSSLRTSNMSHVKLKCDLNICEKGSLRVGVIQQNFGLLLDEELWYQATDENSIDTIVRSIVERHSPNVNDFCIIACKSKGKTIKQALVFPPFIKIHKRHVVERKRINVNILVLDSVSRQHFYRQLPNTVNELRSLVVNSYVKVLDYELFQSLAPRTFPNMRAMFSGIVDVDSNDDLHTYGIDSLFGKFQNMGYQTIVQEDSCWFDSWGSLITDNKHQIHYSSTAKDYADRWQKLLAKTRHLPIDSYGLTHLSCEVFLQYGKTNQFNNPSKVCYNGQFFPSYFLNYTLKFLETVERTKHSYPVLTYTHLNTGHEMTGKRIAYSDYLLADYVRKASELENTLTIILSDHGPKTTKFSREFLTGRYEIAHALLFVILPINIQKFLGRKRMFALERNEKRLINVVDLFHTLMSLNTRYSSGLLSPLPTTRGCIDMPTYSFTTCLCDGYSEHLTDFHHEIHWLAELAVGFLNNEITKSIPTTTTTTRTTNGDGGGETRSIGGGGYGNCERLVGKRYDKIRKQIDKKGNTLYVFDVIVNKYRDEELFEVAVRTRQTRRRTNTNKSEVYNTTIPVFRDAELVRWRRVSIYQHFSKCCDDYLEVELCICRKESSDTTNPARDLSRLLSIASFNVRTTSRFLDSKCLALLVRSNEKVFVSYELTNLCVDRFYNVTFDLVQVNVTRTDTTPIKVSYNTPRNITLFPWLIYFVTSVQFYETRLVERNLVESIRFDIAYFDEKVKASSVQSSNVMPT